MADPADALPALVRVEADGVVRSLAGDPRCRVVLDRGWGRVRLVQLVAGPLELPEGYLPNHLVALNVGADAAGDARLDGGEWQAFRFVHLGVGALPARVPHALRASTGGEFLLVELAEELLAAAGGGAAGWRPLPPEPDSLAAHVILALADEARAGEAAGRALAEGLAIALVTHLAGREPRPPAAPARATLESPRLRSVLDHVARHLDAPLSLHRLAEIADMDVFKFVRAFKQSTGFSPHRYVLEARIARAKELLRGGALSITEIALRTGFATPSHFSVTFRRITHQTPRAYREGVEP